MARYKVTATMVNSVNGWDSAAQIPTFEVEASSATNAIEIAKRVIDPWNLCESHGVVTRSHDLSDFKVW